MSPGSVNRKSVWLYRGRKRVSKTCVCPEGSKFKTKQSFKDECDINRIMKKYDQTGVIDHLSKNQPVYSEMFITPKNAYDAIERVQNAQEVFEKLPARIRDAFKNDPGTFYNFASDPKNHDGLVKLGLARPKAQPKGHSAPPSKDGAAAPKSSKKTDQTPETE